MTNGDYSEQKFIFRDILSNEDMNLDNMFVASLVGDIIR